MVIKIDKGCHSKLSDSEKGSTQWLTLNPKHTGKFAFIARKSEFTVFGASMMWRTIDSFH